MKQLYKSLAIVSLFIIGLGLIGYFLLNRSSDKIPKDYVLVESYVDVKEGDVTCAAMAPGCGDCTDGKVIEGKCYVPKGHSFDGL